jgi:regulatory protein
MQREKASSKRRSGPARIREIDIDVDTLNDPLVVSVVAQVPGRTDRLRLSVNQVELGDVTLDYVVDERLREGRTLTRAEALHVLGALQRTIVLDKALDLLAVRARSTRDLGIRLRRAGARDGDIAWVQDRLTAQGFLNDASFARQLARSKALAGGTSRRRVIGVLRKKGINAEVATAAIDATFADVELDEFGAALAAAEKRLRALASLDPAKRRQRLYAFLARRGYDGDTIRRVLNEIL